MKRIFVLFILTLIGSQMYAQEKMTHEFSVNRVRIYLADSPQQPVFGTLFSISDTTVVLPDTWSKEAYKEGHYSLRTYRLADMVRINENYLSHHLKDEFYSARFLRKYGKQAIVKNKFEHLVSTREIARSIAKENKKQRPNKYRQSLAVAYGKETGFGVKYEIPILKKAFSLVVGVTHRRMRLVLENNFENRYLFDLETNTYGTYVYSNWGTPSNQITRRSFARVYGSFLPQSVTQISAAGRTYFGAKANRGVKLFGDLGVIMNYFHGREMQVDVSNLGHKTLYGQLGTEFKESITVKGAASKWEPQFKLNLGLRFQQRRSYGEFSIGLPEHLNEISIVKNETTLTQKKRPNLSFVVGWLL